jgi:hypothetical protein
MSVQHMVWVVHSYILEQNAVELRFYVPPSFAAFFRSLQFPCIHNAFFTSILRFEISNFLLFTYLERLQREQFLHKMASTERTSVI